MITYRFHYKIICVVLFFVVSWSSVTEARTTIELVDQNMMPLPDAVVEIYSINETKSVVVKTDSFIMDQVNKSFMPNVLVIPTGSLVSFPNSDDIRHHVYSFSTPKTFELKLYAGKPKNPLLFEQKGIVVLGCNIHDEMVGYIYVAESARAYKSNEHGVIELNVPLEQLRKITVWHPNQKTGIVNFQTVEPEQLQVINGKISLMVDVVPPVPRDSFEDTFSHVH